MRTTRTAIAAATILSLGVLALDRARAEAPKGILPKGLPADLWELLVPPENWPRMLKRSVEIGRIPPDLYADHQRWPKEMLAEWGADEGVGAAIPCK